MNKMALVAKLRDDAQEIAIELHMNDSPLGHIQLTAAELEGFIHQLAQHRARMVEQVPSELEPGTKLEAVLDPVWRIPERTPSRLEGILALRHPGFGWLSFAFPDHEAKSVAAWLSKEKPVAH